MSELNPPSVDAGARAPSPTPSEHSVTSDISTTSSKLPKPSGLRPPAATIKSIPSATTSSTSSAATASTSRIGRLCMAHGHGHKAGLPPLELNKQELIETTPDNMRRQSDEYSRSHLPDVYEESEADLVSERKHSNRSTKSRSPDVYYVKVTKGDRKISNGSTNSDLYLEATGRRRSSDHGVVLTTDTDKFIIGQHVWVGGHRPGQIAFIGETHFAAGDWAGIVLDDASGKNDGCVSGKRYFQCEPKRGIFSKLTRLTLEPISGAGSPIDSMNTSTRSITSPTRSGTGSPTHSVRSYVGKSPAKCNLSVGDRVIVSSGMGSRAGILQYVGETKFAPGNWCGVQLDEPSGKNDGTVDGVQYFNCPQNYGIFVPLAKVSLSPLSRKSRLSRAGSKESLTSVGTLGSIASTATSRLRMSAQRLSTAKPPATTPRNTFSMQDLLREKQNHVEQLILERDLTHQQTENDTMMFTKTISQLKEKVATLEKQLVEEQRKTEDLQFSLDEATFCSDELSKGSGPIVGNAQSEEYKEKIANLEKQLLEVTNSIAQKTAESQVQSEDTTAIKNELERIRDELNKKSQELENVQSEREKLVADLDKLQQENVEIEKNTDIKISSLGLSENCLREEIDYLKAQNEELKNELLRKDEANEKEFLSMKHIENELKEELTIVQNELKIKLASLSDNDGAFQKLVIEKDAEIVKQKQLIASLEQQRDNIIKEKDELVSVEKKSLAEANAQNTKIQNDLHQSKQDNEKHLAAIQELQKTISEKSNQIDKLSNDCKSSQDAVDDGQQQLNEKNTLISKYETESKEQQTKINALNEKLKQIQGDFAQMRDGTVSEKDKHIAKLSQDIEELTKRITELSEAKAAFEQQLNDKIETLVSIETKFADLQNSFDLERELNNDFRQQIDTLNLCSANNEQDFTKDLNEKSKEIENLKLAIIERAKQNDDLKKQCDDVASQLSETKSKLATSDEIVKELNGKINNSEELRNASDDTIETLNAEIKKLSNQIELLTKENGEFKTKLTELQSALDASNDANDTKERESKDLRQKIDQLLVQFEQKNSEIDRNNKSIEELTGKLQAAQQENVDSVEKLSKLEVEFGDLQRKLTVIEEKSEQLLAEKASLQQNLDTLQCSSSDTNTEIIRLSDELKTKQKTYDDLVDSSNTTKLGLEKRLHECQQNLLARTSQWERVKNEMESLTVQKIDRENELNLELSKIKESYENEVESLKNEIDAIKASFKDEKEKLIKSFQENDSQAEVSRNELKTTADNLENTIKNLTKEVANGRREIEQKNKDLSEITGNLEALETKLKSETEHSKENELNLEKSNKELVESRNAVEALNVQINEKLSLITSLEERVSSLLTQIETSIKEKVELQDLHKVQTIEYETSAKNLRIENEKLLTENAKWDAKFKELTDTFRDTEDEQVDLVNKTIEYQTQISQLSESVKELKSREELLKQHENSLTEQKALIETLRIEIDEKSKQLSNENTDKAKIMAELETQLNESHAKLSENEKHQALIKSQLLAKSEDFEKYKNDAEQAKSEIENLIKTTVNDSNEKDKVIKTLEDKITQLTSSVNLSDDLKNELNDKSEKLKLKETNISELSNTIDSLRKECTEKDEKLSKLTNEKELENKRSLDELQHKAAETIKLTEQLDSLQKLANNQAEQLNSYTANQATLEIENDELKKKIQETTDLLDKIKTDSQNKMIELSQTSSSQTNEVTKLRAELEQLAEEKKKEIEEITLKLWDGETKIKEQSEEIVKFNENQLNSEELENAKRLLKTRETELLLANKKLEGEILSLKSNLKEKDRLLAVASSTSPPKQIDFVSDGETGAQISFLNSIIADMQKKNEALKEQIQSADLFKNPMFDIPVKRKPAPRLFCDICDVFDEHDTEDCPIQSSDNSPAHTMPQVNASNVTATNDDGKKKRILPPARKYCENCEVFGHEAGECDAEETY